MRRLILSAMVLALAACQGEAGTGDGKAPAQAAQAPAEDIPVRFAADGVQLLGPPEEGEMKPSIELLAFGTPQAEVEARLAELIGEPEETSSNAECGAGPMDFATYPAKLVLNYQDGKLVGWLLENGSELKTSKGVTTGVALGNFVLLHRAQLQPDSTLGVEYYADTGIGAFMTEDGDAGRVETIFAGTTCFFR